MALSLITGLIAGSGTFSPAAAVTQSVLHSMCSSASCADGGIAQTQLLKSGSILYGVAPYGGSHKSASHGAGVVFQYDTSNGTYTVLYNFCTTIVFSSCSDGESPTGRLIADTSGNLYGTTSLGGNSHNAGTVYKLVKPTGGGTTWTLQSLYKFCPVRIGSVECDDGDDPQSGVTYAGAASGTAYDGTSLLFGTTYVGGLDNVGSYGNGIMFALQLSGGTWTEQVIHTFCAACAELCNSCGDGELPIGQMVMDASNRIWGSALVGGTGGQGIVYELTPGANLWSDPWTETNVYTFCPSHPTKCSDGGQPTGVLLDASANIFGTTQIGGSGPATTGNGILWKLTSSGGTWSQTVAYNFCGSTSCTDGSSPRGDLIMDGSGNIYGTTAVGGSHAIVSGGGGTIWKYDGSAQSVLYAFCPSSSTCTDGQDPGAGVMMDASGNLYGSTILGGGTPQDGVLYKLAP